MQNEHKGQAVPSNHRININQGMINMPKYVSIIRSKAAPEGSYTDEDIFAGSDALNYFTYAICGNNTDLTIDVLIENLVSLIVNTSEVEDHRPDIRYYTGLFMDRLEDAFEAHDELFSDEDLDDEEEDHQDIDEEDDDDDNPDSDDDPDITPPKDFYQKGIATALKVKITGKDPIVIPVDCVDDILCDKHKKPGFCLCKLRNLGYPIPEDTSQVEYVKAVKVPTKTSTFHYDGFRVIITELPERVPDGQ